MKINHYGEWMLEHYLTISQTNRRFLDRQIPLETALTTTMETFSDRLVSSLEWIKHGYRVAYFNFFYSLEDVENNTVRVRYYSNEYQETFVVSLGTELQDLINDLTQQGVL